MVARHEWRWSLVEGFVEVRHPHPPQLQHVAKPPGGEQCGRGPLAFQDCVGRHRAAMQQLFECVERGTEFFEQVAHSGNHRVRVVVRSGRELSGGDPPVRREHGHVGESTADVGGGAGDGRWTAHVQRRAPFGHEWRSGRIGDSGHHDAKESCFSKSRLAEAAGSDDPKCKERGNAGRQGMRSRGRSSGWLRPCCGAADGAVRSDAS